MKKEFHHPIFKSSHSKAAIAFCILLFTFCLSSCGVYSFKDVSIQPPNAKTIHIGYIENKARYVNPLLSPQLTDKFKQKVSTQVSKLSQVQGSDADFDVVAYISGYDVTTSGVTNQQAASNRLTITVHIDFKNHLDDKRSFSADISRNFDYSASLTLNVAEAQLLSTIISNTTDEMFNRIFSNW
ncbi:MAG TPA: LPS assembly lipoprotein LptE [Puia sp.]|jgi:hypothetical protein|nr:LPS assembly lipoprotein LptE [Puia sp.]